MIHQTIFYFNEKQDSNFQKNLRKIQKLNFRTYEMFNKNKIIKKTR